MVVNIRRKPKFAYIRKVKFLHFSWEESWEFEQDEEKTEIQKYKNKSSVLIID